MATDREIKGVLIKTYSGDAPSFGRGDIWYNSVNDKLRTSAAYAAGGTWSSGGTAPIGLSASGISVGTNNLNTIHYGASSSTIPANSNQPVSWTYSAPTTTWTQTAARNTARTDASGTGTSYTSCLIYGGSNNGPGTKPFTNSKPTEEWDGATWTTTPANLNTGRNYAAGFGNSTESAYIAGGESDPTPPGGPHSTAVEYFNGTTWTTIASLNTQRRYLRGCGSTDSAIVFGGDSDPPSQSLVESYNGSSWTEVADIPTAGNSYGNAGSSKNDVLIFGGPSNETNYFNGTTWTAASNITTGGGRPSGGGASASAIAAFGAPSPYNTVELYDVPAGGVAVDIDFTA
jgi:hypothetical protein